MAQAVQYTLEQVSQQLNLPEAVIKKLSQQFHLPMRYYHQPVGHPKLYLYHPSELAKLRWIHQRLVAGESLKEIKASFPQQDVVMDDQHLLPQWDSQDLPLSESESLDLVEYEEDDRLKEHLAQVTFKQYRLNTESAKAPLEAMVNALRQYDQDILQNQARERAIAQLSEPAFDGKQFQFVYQSSHIGLGFTPLSPVARTVSSELQQRIIALQHELIAEQN